MVKRVLLASAALLLMGNYPGLTEKDFQIADLERENRALRNAVADLVEKNRIIKIDYFKTNAKYEALLSAVDVATGVMIAKEALLKQEPKFDEDHFLELQKICREAETPDYSLCIAVDQIINGR